MVVNFDSNQRPGAESEEERAPLGRQTAGGPASTGKYGSEPRFVVTARFRTPPLFVFEQPGLATSLILTGIAVSVVAHSLRIPLWLITHVFDLTVRVQ